MRVLFVGVGLVGCLISMGALFSAYHRVFDLLSHFRIQYIVLISLVLCVAVLSRRYKSSAILLVCLSVHIVEVVSSQTYPEVGNTTAKAASSVLSDGLKSSLSSDDSAIEKQSQSRVMSSIDKPSQLRVMSSNLLAGNINYDAHVRFIKSVNPDVIVFQEYTFDWQTALVPALEDYAYRIEVPALHAFGNALFSKYPLKDIDTPALVNSSRKSVDGTIVFDGATLRVFGTHPPPPMSQRFYEDRNTHLQKLAAIASAYTEPMVVMGDLNITPWSSHFQSFINNANLFDGRRGQGILPTWPVEIPLLQIPIDHILLNRGVRVVSLQVSSDLESDHKAIWADIVLNR